MRFPARLVDLTGDGRLDLVGTLPHYYAPGGELGGIVCIPQVVAETRGELEFGEMARLRYKQSAEDDQLKHFMGPYLVADVVDVNRDGRPDVIYTTTSKTTRFQSDKNIHKYVHVFLNSGRRDAGGMPEFVFDRKFPPDGSLNRGFGVALVGPGSGGGPGWRWRSGPGRGPDV